MVWNLLVASFLFFWIRAVVLLSPLDPDFHPLWDLNLATALVFVALFLAVIWLAVAVWRAPHRPRLPIVAAYCFASLALWAAVRFLALW
jgi:hypothetical protein